MSVDLNIDVDYYGSIMMMMMIIMMIILIDRHHHLVPSLFGRDAALLFSRITPPFDRTDENTCIVY